MTGRSLKDTVRYIMFRHTQSATSSCVFCNYSVRQDKCILQETTHFVIVKNDFPYKWWLGMRIHQHLLLIPKRHVKNLSELSTTEKTEFILLLADYEHKGYTFYLRSQNDPTRSVEHLHGHLFSYRSKKS